MSRSRTCRRASASRSRELKKEWRRPPKRHNRKESLKLIVCHALRTPGDGEAAWKWLARAHRGSIARAVSPEAAVKVAREVAVW
jgi:hypothetical protein